MVNQWPYKIIVCLATSIALTSCAPHNRPSATTQPIPTPQEIPGIRNFAWVSPSLCRGAQPTAAGFEQLRGAGVNTIIDVRGKSRRDQLDALAFKYVQIPTSVTKPDEQQIIEFLRAVRDPQNRPVFIHDEAGSDRVGLYIAAYRIVEQGWTIKDANVELLRFHFNPYWAPIADFLNRMDADSIRRQLSVAPFETIPSTRKAVR